MTTLNYSGAKDKPTETLPSHRDQPGEQSVLPPFSGELKVDDELQFSRQTFKQKIDDFSKDKHITPPTSPHNIARISHTQRVGPVCLQDKRRPQKGETDAQYETRLALTDGRELL